MIMFKEKMRKNARSTEEIDNIESNNAWLQDSTTIDDIDRQSSKFAEDFINHHLRGSPYGMKTNQIKRAIEAYYSVSDPTLLLYTVRKIAQSPKTWYTIEDYTKPDDYYITYNRDSDNSSSTQ